MRTSAPSYPSGPAVTLAGRGLGLSFGTDSGGSDYAVDDSGGVYHLVNGAWIYDENASITFQQVAQLAPGAISQATDSSSTFAGAIDALKAILPAYVQYKAQADILATNLDLAKMGKPPLNSNQMSAGFNFGLSSDTQGMLFKLGLIGLAIFGVTSMMRHR